MFVPYQSVMSLHSVHMSQEPKRLCSLSKAWLSRPDWFLSFILYNSWEENTLECNCSTFSNSERHVVNLVTRMLCYRSHTSVAMEPSRGRTKSQQKWAMALSKSSTARTYLLPLDQKSPLSLGSRYIYTIASYSPWQEKWNVAKCDVCS